MHNPVLLQALDVYVPFYPNDTYTMICTTVSLISAVLVLIMILVTKINREPVGSMVTSILLVDIVYCSAKAIDFLTPSHKKTNFECQVVEIFAHFGVTASFFWSAFFGHALLLISKTHNIDSVSNVLKYYIGISTGTGVLFAAVTPLFDFVTLYDNGIDEAYCSHKIQAGRVDWSYIILADVPLVVCCLFSIYWYVRTWSLIKNWITGGNAKVMLILTLFPAILLICWIPALILNTITIFGGQPHQSIFVLVQAIGNLQGFFDALAYGGSRKAIRDLLCCKCFGKRNSTNGSVSLEENLNTDFNIDSRSPNSGRGSALVSGLSEDDSETIASPKGDNSKP